LGGVVVKKSRIQGVGGTLLRRKHRKESTAVDNGGPQSGYLARCRSGQKIVRLVRRLLKRKPVVLDGRNGIKNSWRPARRVKLASIAVSVYSVYRPGKGSWRSWVGLVGGGPKKGRSRLSGTKTLKVFQV